MKRLLNCCTPWSSILEDKELKWKLVDLQKLSRYTMCVPNAWRPFLRRGDTKEGLNNPSGIGCGGKTLVDW